MCKSCEGQNAGFCDIFVAPKKIGKRRPGGPSTYPPLNVTHPHLLAEWDWEYNNSIAVSPYDVTCGSEKIVGWVDKFQHRWAAAVFNRAMHGNGCHFCSNRVVGYGNDLLTNYPELCEEWHPTKNFSGPENYTPGSGKIAWWICKVCGGVWDSTIGDRTRGQGCPFCTGKRVGYGNDLLTNFPELCLEWDYEKNEFGPENYTCGSGKKVWWKCKICSYGWSTTISNRTYGYGCQKCSKGQISKISQDWLDNLEIESREVTIPGFGFRVDGFDSKTNTIYEFLGDFWHGNPKLYATEDKNPISKKTFGQLYNQTSQRFEKLKQAGYNIVYIWESDYKDKINGAS
jgi:hypothetical protein